MGRHTMVEVGSPTAPVRVPAPRSAPVRPVWVPPGYDAPPAGLDGPLDGPPVRGSAPRAIVPRPARRTTVTAVAGALGVAVAVLVTGGTALTALAQTAADAPVASTQPPRAAATAQGCSKAVADELDATAAALGSGSWVTWSETVRSHADTVADTYGRGSAEDTAFASGASEILSWLSDPGATESYQQVVDRIVPSVVTTCDRAYA